MAEYKNTLAEGTVLDSGSRKYRIEKVLGKGGFGITYLATGEVQVGNVVTEASFAIKEHFPEEFCKRSGSNSLPREDSAGSYADSRAEFLKEAQRLYSLGMLSPNIVKVNEVFESNGTAYYVMEYIKGQSLRDYVEKSPGGKLPLDDVRRIIAPVIDALEILHDKRVNHLDIKPENIMLKKTMEGTVPVLIDFGLSVHYKKNGNKTSSKKLMGYSDGYSPQELYLVIEHFLPQAGIYSLACTTLFMLTGERPKRANELKVSEVRAQLETLKLPEEFIDGLCRALVRNYDERTASVAQFRADLGIGGGGDGTVILKTKHPTVERWWEKWWYDGTFKWFLGGAGAVLLLSLILFLAGRGCNSSPTPRPVAPDSIQVAPADSLAVDSLATDSVNAAKTVPGDTVAKPATTAADKPQKEPKTNNESSTGPKPTTTPGREPERPQPASQTSTRTFSGPETVMGVQVDQGWSMKTVKTDGVVDYYQIFDANGNKVKTIIP